MFKWPKWLVILLAVIDAIRVAFPPEAKEDR